MEPFKRQRSCLVTFDPLHPFQREMGLKTTVKMLNEYFDVMYDVITGNEGILDKYIGDAIMAVFGAPFKSPNDVDNALQAAIGMTKTLREFNTKRPRGKRTR